MISRWYEFKHRAIELRKKGFSIRQIETQLNIPRSTLSGWFKHIILKNNQKEILKENWKNSLNTARLEASKWHKLRKIKNIGVAQESALSTLKKIDLKDVNLFELCLAMLYLGEGFKKNMETGIGNSDPLILKFFVFALKNIYDMEDKITCHLHLRADQNEQEIKKFWSKELGVPINRFRRTSFDRRTIGSKSYGDYKGVCVVRCGKIAIQRKLVYLSRIYCEEILKLRD